MKRFDFATADLIDAAPYARSCETQFCQYGRRRVFGGKIRTLKCRGDSGAVKKLMNALSDGEVLVVDGGGSLSCALLGDVAAAAGAANGWAGAVVYGAVRDLEALHETDFGIKALGSNPRKISPQGDTQTDVPLCFGGVDFIPGHYLYSDADGIVVSERPLLPERE
ncbi:MAG: ribonuclease E activity regulator RraA [Neisseria sp.]|nr:ribonuclease E activity regulator RraA [Neisseria sp.]